MDDDGWTTHGYWWNGRWGRLAQVDLKHRSRGTRHAVLERTGGADGRVVVHYDGTDREAASAAVKARLAIGDGWRDKLDAVRASAAHIAAARADRVRGAEAG